MNQVLEQCLREIALAAEQGERNPWLGAWVPGLLREAEVAGELVRRIAAGEVDDGDDEPPEHVLLADLLDEARRAEEDERADGGRFLAAVREEVERLAPDGMTPDGRMTLARLHARAQLRVPESLVAATPADLLDGVSDGPADADELAGDLLSSLDRYLAECGGDLYQLHATMQEMLAAAPDEARNALIHRLASAADDRWQRLSLYWMLDRDPAIRAAVADAWREQSRAGALAPAVTARIPLLRNWLPGDEARAAVDEALAAMRRRQANGAALPDPANWDEAQVSLPDGAGAQHIAVATPGGGKRRRTWAMILIKAGHGVRDAYLLSELNPGDEEQIVQHLRQSADAMAVTRETVERLLAGAMAENLAAGDPPAHGLIDVATTLGPGELRPRALTPADLRSLLDPAGELERLSPQKRGRLINQSAEWADDLCTFDSWFEDTATVERILDSTASRPRVRERELRAHLETRRTWWAGQCLRSALVLRDGAEPALFDSFLATGAALLDGRDLKKIPLMEQVLSRTVEVWQGRRVEGGDEPYAGAGGPGDEMPNESTQAAGLVGSFSAADRKTLESFYNDGPGACFWPAGFFGVHGYLFAVVTHPDMMPPSVWLPELLGEDAGDEAGACADHDQFKAVVGSLLSLYNRINDQVLAGEPALPEGCVLRQPPVANFWPGGAVGQWSRGFQVARERFGHQADFLEEVLDDSDPEQQQIIVHSGLATVTLEAFSDRDRIADAVAEIPAHEQPSLDGAAAEVSANFHEHLQVCAALACTIRDMSGDHEYDGDGDLPPASLRTPVTPVRREAKTGRNEPCPCGSGRKYKRCCADPRR